MARDRRNPRLPTPYRRPARHPPHRSPRDHGGLDTDARHRQVRRRARGPVDAEGRRIAGQLIDRDDLEGLDMQAVVVEQPAYCSASMSMSGTSNTRSRSTCATLLLARVRRQARSGHASAHEVVPPRHPPPTAFAAAARDTLRTQNHGSGPGISPSQHEEIMALTSHDGVIQCRSQGSAASPRLRGFDPPGGPRKTPVRSTLLP